MLEFLKTLHNRQNHEGTDQAFSLSGSAMKRMVRDIKRIEKALGNDEKKCESEIEPMQKMKKVLFS